MPVRLALKNARRLKDFGVIERATDKLDSHRQAVLAKAARYGDGRQSGDIADAANRIGKGQRFVQIGVQFAGGHGQSSSGQNVNMLVNFFHRSLQNGAHTLRHDEVRCADFFIHVAADFAQWIGQLGHPA
jgi:hypothetical protein